jgi:phosphomethylpyrimidine synthase
MAIGCRVGELLKTQLDHAKEGNITAEMKEVADIEKLDLELIRRGIEKAEIIIMTRDGSTPLGIGRGLTTKINCNLGTSSTTVNIDTEIQKAKIAEKFGADTISDLSMGGDIDDIRKRIISATTVPLTTVPIYQTLIDQGSFKNIEFEDILATIKKHVNDGISSIVIHAGLDLKMLDALKKNPRTMGVVSKGGSFTSAWMLENKQENPFLVNFDEILNIFKNKDVVLSLGNAMRSGCIHDIRDTPQDHEILKNEELAEKAYEKGVQAIVEGMGGHVRASEIDPFVRYYKEKTKGRPLFVAGPLPTEIGVGHDHISGAIGGSLAAGAGADYLCSITAAEHLNLPSLEHVREGVIAFKIAAHVGDTVKYGLSEKDLKLSEQRRSRNWEGQYKYALDPERARDIHPENEKVCTMCGKHCALLIMEKYLSSK